MADKDLVKLLSSENFDPNDYVQSLSKQTDGAAETFTATRDQVRERERELVCARACPRARHWGGQCLKNDVFFLGTVGFISSKRPN